MNRLCSWGIVGFIIFGQLQLVVSGLHLATISVTGRTEILKAVELALGEIRQNSTIFGLESITMSHYLVTLDDAGATYQLSNSICEEIKKDPTKHPDVLIDLSLFTENRCVFQYAARQIDAGMITVDNGECGFLDVEPAGSDPSTTVTSIGVPSVRFPESASIAALSAFSDRLLTALHSDTVFFTDEVLGPHMVFSDFDKLQFVGRYFIKLEKAPNTVDLFELMNNVNRVVQSELWIIKVTDATMTAMLQAMDTGEVTSSLLNTSWLIYDGSLDSKQCQVLCYTDQTGQSRCGLQKNTKEFLCIKLDLNKADTASLTKLAERIGSGWTDQETNQLDLAFAYESIKTAVIAYNGLKQTNRWPSQLTAPENATLCQITTPALTTDTRYYRFAEAIKNLPARVGCAGEIIFNGSVVNNNARLRLLRCKNSEDLAIQVCHDMNATYAYMNNEMESSGELPELGHRTKLRVLVINDPPFVVKTEDGWTGYSVEVFDKIAKGLKLSYTLIEQEDNIYGVKLANGQWNGMIGQIASKHADIGLGPIIQDGERKMVVDFTIPYYDSAGLTMLISTNTDQPLGPFFFLEVFTTPVWICCICAVSVVSVLVYILDKFSPYSYQNQAVLTDGPSEGTMFTLKESIWYVLGACTQQGESLDPRSMSTRILITGHWIFVVIMVSMFSANLSARLTVSGLKEEIKSLEELAVQTDVRYTVRNNSAEYSFFRKMYQVEESLFKVWRDLSMNLTEFTSNYSVWQYPITERYGTIFKRMNEWGFTTSTSDSLAHVRNGWVIFMESPLAAYYIASSCDLRQLGERIGSWHYGIALAPKSFLTSSINSMILHLKAENELETLEKKWWSTNVTNCPETSTTSGFGIEQVGGMFILLACGFIAGGLILVIELIAFHLIMRRAEKRAQANPPKSSIPEIKLSGSDMRDHISATSSTTTLAEDDARSVDERKSSLASVQTTNVNEPGPPAYRDYSQSDTTQP